MNTHLLQSHEWEAYSKLEGHQTFWLDGDGYQLLAIQHSTPLGNYLYCPYGPALDPKHPEESLKQALSALKNLAHEQNAFFIRIEPTSPFDPSTLTKLGLIKSHDLDPAHTWVLDLTIPQEEILSDIEKRKLRHWRTHINRGITLRTTQDPEQITILTKFLTNLGERDHFNPQDENHLKNQLKSGFATLYIAELEGQPIAAALIYDYNGVRYYAHAATDDEHRKLMAGTIILIQMIIDAQDSGAKTFDFWGITTSNDPTHPWYGFTQYKKSFGGQQVDYSGTWDLPLNHLKYSLYNFLRRLNRAKRKK